MKDLNKELEKKYERMGKLRADISVMPRPFTITIYTLIIISVVGLLLSFLLGITIAMWVAAGSLLVVILMYFIASRICPVRYTEVMVKSEGKRLVFQVLSEKNVIFSDGEYTLEYKNKEIKERPSGIMYPELSYAAPLKAHYTRTESKSNKMFYVGDYTTADGKKIVYKVQVSVKFVDGFSANGKKVVFDCINDRSTGLGIPAALAEEIIKRGTVLPKNDIFLSKR